MSHSFFEGLVPKAADHAALRKRRLTPHSESAGSGRTPKAPAHAALQSGGPRRSPKAPDHGALQSAGDASYSGLTHTFRNRTGLPWSWSMTGPGAFTSRDIEAAVGPGTSTLT